MSKKLFLIILGIILVVVAINLMIFFKKDDYVAIVSNEKISESEYKYFLYKLKSKVETTMLDINSNYEIGSESFWHNKIPGEKNISAGDYLKEQALVSNIEFRLQLIKARENKIMLNNTEKEEVKKKVDETVSKNGSGELKDIFKNSSMKKEEYSNLETQLAIVRKFVEEEKKKISYTEAQLYLYYSAKKDKFDQVTLGQILIKRNSSNNIITVSDEEKAKKIIGELKKSDSFETIFKKYSKELGMKDSEKFINLNEKDKNIAKDLLKWGLENPIGLVEQKKSSSGYGVFYIFSKKDTFEASRKEVLERYVHEEYIKKVEEWRKNGKNSERINETIYKNIEIF